MTKPPKDVEPDKLKEWYRENPNKSPGLCSYLRVDIPLLDLLCLLCYTSEKAFRLITAALLFAVALRYGLIAAVVSFLLRLGIIVNLSEVMKSVKTNDMNYIRDCVYKALMLMASDNLADRSVPVKVVAIVLSTFEGAAYLLLFMLYGGAMARSTRLHGSLVVGVICTACASWFVKVASCVLIERFSKAVRVGADDFVYIISGTDNIEGQKVAQGPGYCL